MTKSNAQQDALDYHEKPIPGKIAVIPTKPYSTQRDLSLAYSPGVAEPCKIIAEEKESVYKYTSKGNLVAVISNGTAVLGLGDIGPEASKPVMEGKGVLFKIFADIDVFDIEVDTKNIDEFVKTVKLISPTFGGINLEDIKAPECFEIERRLKEELSIPIMHDDQHGTAIISSAALLNALLLVKKDIAKVKIIINGAGAAAISCTKLYLSLGAQKENITMLDKDGVLHHQRTDLNPYNQFFQKETDARTLSDAIVGADVFVGLSAGNVLTQEMIKQMAKDPIVFAMANPIPEISYEEGIAARPDIIMATGRSDYPNQVNNVLGFPYIFRGALDVRATCINEEMKLAAVYAIAELAKTPVPEAVVQAYNLKNIVFGKDYIIPKPLDNRLISIVAPAVAKAAMESGVAKQPIENWAQYIENLQERLGLDNKLIKQLTNKAQANPKKVVLPEGESFAVLKAAQIVKEEGIAFPILLGNIEKIKQIAKTHELDLSDIQIIDPKSPEQESKRLVFAQEYFRKRQRKGITLHVALKIMRERNYFACMMVEKGEADACVSGNTRSYPETILPALRVIGKQEKVNKIAGMYILISKHGPLFLSDISVNKDLSVNDIVDITLLTAEVVKQLQIIPKIALLSYSNFGSSDFEEPNKMAEAAKILHKKYPQLIVDGEIQADFALNPCKRTGIFPFSKLEDKSANTLIFPNLAAGNIAYKLLKEVGELDSIGPILMGLKKPVHVLQLNSSVREIVNMITLAVNDAQRFDK